ncbi:MAG TPA: PQQ-dependent sugar dehydrogenase [Nocardioidaceae bacterium]|nr:PQQ-dependent sugar dehydrogenase [Nocardioidaceae bacterium]
MRTRTVISALVGTLSAACVLGSLPLSATGSTQVTQARAEARAAAAPALRVRVVMRNLDIPWDTAFLPNGAMLVTERSRKRILLRMPRGRVRVVARNPRGIWASGETGLMDLAVDPRFRRNRRFYTCHGANRRGGGHDVRVVAWRLNGRSTRARRVETLLAGIPATSGRHGGCRVEIDPRGRMWIATGDAAIGRNPQRLRSLGGKVLRINRFTGRPAAGNPYRRAGNRNKRKVVTHGHRNVQGLAWRPGDGMWSVEHGSFRDDEVNRLVGRGDYGWHPVPGYNEQVPMTDHRLPGRQRAAKWRSGAPTVATSGADWLTHRRWGAWRGRLAVAALKDSSLRIMRFSGRNRLVGVQRPRALTRFGRLRSVTLGPRGALYITTSNGGGNDRVLRVVPRRR